MDLPGSQQRTLMDIERDLTGSDPHLAAMFGVFTRLNQGEPISAERVKGQRLAPMARRRLMFVVMVLPAMLVLAALSTLVGGTAHGITICSAFGSPGRSVASRASCPSTSTSSSGPAATPSAAAEGSSCSASLPAARFTGRTADAATPVPPELAAVTTAGPAAMCLQ